MKSAEAPEAASLDAELQAARDAFDRGQLDRAAERCNKLLASATRSSRVLGLLGEIEYKRGNATAALKWLGDAIAVDRRDARAHWISGNLYQDAGSLDRAIASYRRALRAQPRLAEAHNDLGTAYFAKGWHPEAEQCYRRALELQPENFAAVENLAATLRAQGKLREARDAFIRALKLRVVRGIRRLFGRESRPAPPVSTAQSKARSEMLAAARKLITANKWSDAEAILRNWLATAPDDPDALHMLGAALALAKRNAEAIACLERAIALRSTVPELFVMLGNVLAEERQHVKAIESYEKALRLDPANGPATANIAHILHDLGHFREAEEIYRLSLQHEPDTADAHSSFAGTLISLGKYADAETAARKALELNPVSLHAHVALAAALLEQARIDEARGVFRKAEQIDPDNPLLLRWLGQYEMVFNADYARAETILRRAHLLAPEDSGIHINLARSLLARNRFAEGWEEYEWRKRETSRAGSYRKFPYPEWEGASLEGKAIAVVGEQGIGDEVMFASCLAEVASKACRCVLYCNRRLETLFRRSFPFADVIGGSHVDERDAYPVLPGIDYQIAAGSLPRVLRRAEADFPHHDGYLKTDEQAVAQWHERLAQLGPGLKIGLSWKGGTPLSDVTRRTLKLDALRSLLVAGGTHWVSLQYGDSAAEREAFTAASGIALHHWQSAVDDLDVTAALMCALDLRISVCNTQVHLCGALGKEVWVLAPVAPEWRYGSSGDTMLWYPAARMFRQAKIGEWAPVVSRIADDLAKRLDR